MNAKIEKLTKELDHARNEAIAARTERETMKKKCEFMDETVVKMSVRNKQAVDLVSNRKDFHPNGKGALSFLTCEVFNKTIISCFRIRYGKRS